MSDPIAHTGAQPEPLLATIGDISISQHWVCTPAGTYPIRGSEWTFADETYYEQRRPVGAIVLACVFGFFCFLFLLLLLIKKPRLAGYVRVTVHGNGFHHETTAPVTTAATIWDTEDRVDYARSLAAAI